MRALDDVEKAISLVDRYAYIKLVLAQLAVRLRIAVLKPHTAARDTFTR
jgi:hypothetical protein